MLSHRPRRTMQSRPRSIAAGRRRALAFAASLRDAVVMRSKGNLLRFMLATLCVLPGFPLGARAAEEAAPAPVPAIWKDQELAFYFQSQTTFYSCSSLE